MIRDTHSAARRRKSSKSRCPIECRECPLRFVYFSRTQCFIGAGWSSPVARQAHNLKVVGSNPTPATKKLRKIKRIGRWYSDTTGLLRVYIIATSTPALKNSIRLLSHATGDSGRHSRTSGTSVPVMARGDPLAQGLHIRWTEARGHCVRHTLHHRAIVRSSGLRGPGRPELTASMTEACRPVARRHRIAL